MLVAVGLFVLVVGAIATARLTEVPSTPIWVVVATAGLGLISTFATDILSARLQSLNSQQQNLLQHCLNGESGQIPRVDAVTDLLPLGVRAARPNGGVTPLANTTYVTRDVDTELDQALVEGGLIIASGPPTSGRTRSLYEALRRVYPERLLLAPRDHAALVEIIRAGIPYRRSVIWLDRIERFIGTDGLELYTLVRQSPRGRRAGVVVGTIGADAFSIAAHQPDLVTEALRSARAIPVADVWSEGELVRARLVARKDPVLAIALDKADDKSRFLSHLVGGPVVTPVSEHRYRYLLPPAPRCLGRDAQVAEIVSLLSGANPSPVCVLGAPGMGKSTVLRAVLHNASVHRRFGQRRVFVRCEGSISAETVLAELAVALHVRLGNDLLGRVLDELASAPTVLALSGLGQPWDRDPARIEDLLGRLAGVGEVALAVSLLGAAAPLGVAWASVVRLPRLDHQTAKELFLSVAGKEFAADSHLNDLVAAQDGVPLAVELLAFAAQGEPNLAAIWRRWAAGLGSAESMVDTPGYHRFDASIEMSIESVRMNATSLKLLSVLGVLPDGADILDLDKLMPGTGDVAAATLRRVGLAYDEQGRLRMLKPIQDYVARNRPLGDDGLGEVARHYINLARVLSMGVGAANGSSAAARLVAEAANIEVMVTYGLATTDPVEAGHAACALADYTRYTGIGGSELLTNAVLAARRVGDVRLEAECIYHLADLDLRQSRLSSALDNFRQAAQLFEREGDLHFVADSTKHIGDVLFELCDFDTAEEHFQRSAGLFRELGDRRGWANCVKCRGDVAERHADYPSAVGSYQDAMATFQDLGDELGIADCVRRLADVDIALADPDTANERYALAARAYGQTGAVLGLANCMLGQANVALLRADPSAALEFVQRAEPQYGRMKYVRGQAKCVETLGRLALARDESTAAREHFVCARELFETVNDVVGEADCLLGLARAEKDTSTASGHARAALGLYQRVGRLIGVAHAHERLATLAADPQSQIPQARLAIEVWQQMGRSEAVARLTSEFPGA